MVKKNKCCVCGEDVINVGEYIGDDWGDGITVLKPRDTTLYKAHLGCYKKDETLTWFDMG
jgi:hypothetical protein